MDGSRAFILLFVAFLGAALACGGSSDEDESGWSEAVEEVEAEVEELPLTEPEVGPDITEDLKSEWFFGAGGGSGMVCPLDAPDGDSLPNVTLAGVDLLDPALCLWGFPLNEPIDIRLQAPDGQVFEGTYGVLDSTAGSVNYTLLSPPTSQHGVVRGHSFGIYPAGAAIQIRVNLTVDLPTGTWLVGVRSGGVAAEVPVEVEAPNFEAISVLPSGSGLNPLASLCEDNAFAQGDELTVVGTNFPPDQDVALGVYLWADTTARANRVFDATVTTDPNGEMATTLVVEPSDMPGVYWVVVTSDPDSDFTGRPDESGMPFVYRGARDCFTIYIDN